MDEGGIPYKGNSKHRSYIPSKPNPNCIEYYMAVDASYFITRILWETPTRYNKFGRPKKMKQLIFLFLKHYATYVKDRRNQTQPFIFYLDSRFTSMDVLKKMHEYGFYGVMACRSNMAPLHLMRWLDKEIPLRSWRVIYNEKYKAFILARRIKKRKCQYLMSNCASIARHRVGYVKASSLKKTRGIWSPRIQRDYNRGACYIDIVNKMLLRYWRRPQYLSSKHAYFSFFVHAACHQSYIAWKSLQNQPSTKNTMLWFRENVLGQLNKKKSDPIENSKFHHWPIPKKVFFPNKIVKCQHSKCRNNSTSFCRGCNKYMCLAHMHLNHQFLWK